MNDITALAQRMKAAAEKATPGEWCVFSHSASGTYAVHTPKDRRCGDVIKWPGFDGQENAENNAEFIAIANPANTKALVEALEKREELRTSANRVVNQQDIELQELRKRNAELVEALEKVQQQNGHIREQSDEWERKAISNFEECAEMSARIEELESQRKLAFTAGNRWADKFREAEKRIASLESRTVTVKLTDVNEYLADVHDKTLALTFRRLAEGVRAGDIAEMTAAGIQVIEGGA